MSIQVSIDRDRCMGSGNCAYWAPGTFDLDAENIAIVARDPSSDGDRVRQAVDNCPTAAISITDA